MHVCMHKSRVHISTPFFFFFSFLLVFFFSFPASPTLLVFLPSLSFFFYFFSKVFLSHLADSCRPLRCTDVHTPFRTVATWFGIFHHNGHHVGNPL